MDDCTPCILVQHACTTSGQKTNATSQPCLRLQGLQSLVQLNAVSCSNRGERYAISTPASSYDQPMSCLYTLPYMFVCCYERFLPLTSIWSTPELLCCADIAINMGNQQQVCVRTEDGRSYPVMLFDGRLDVDASKEQLANEGLLLTRLNGTIPSCDRSGMSRAAFTGDIRGQNKLKKGKAACLLGMHAWPWFVPWSPFTT